MNSGGGGSFCYQLGKVYQLGQFFHLKLKYDQAIEALESSDLKQNTPDPVE